MAFDSYLLSLPFFHDGHRLCEGCNTCIDFSGSVRNFFFYQVGLCAYLFFGEILMSKSSLSPIIIASFGMTPTSLEFVYAFLD